MRALSVKQPFAERIASGAKTIEYRTWCISEMGPLLICASKGVHEDHDGMGASELARLPLGVTVCVVDLTKITGRSGDYEWHLARPRRVEACDVRGYAAIYTVDDTKIRYLPAPIIRAHGVRAATSRARPRARAAGRA